MKTACLKLLLLTAAFACGALAIDTFSFSVAPGQGSCATNSLTEQSSSASAQAARS